MSIYIIPAVTIISVVIFTLWMIISKLVDYKRRQAEIGIMIGDKTYWDRGYGTDAILTLVNGIFRTTDLDYLYLHTLAGNIRAQQAFANAGFCPVRSVTREGNHFIFMEALRDEWLQRHKLPEERSET